MCVMDQQGRSRVLEIKLEQLRGRYKIITAVITTIGVVLSGIFGTVVGRNSSDESNHEIIMQQDNTINDLQTELNKVKNNYITLEEEKEKLSKEYQEILTKLESMPNQAPNDDENAPANTIEQTSGEVVKLTSCRLLGNNEDSFNFVNNTTVSDDTARSNIGDTFNSSISMRHNGNIDFLLEENYKDLIFTFSIAEETRDIDDYSSTITIYAVEGNGENETVKLLYSTPAVTMGLIPEECPPINVEGVVHLRISFYAEGNPYSVPRIILGNPVLTK